MVGRAAKEGAVFLAMADHPAMMGRSTRMPHVDRYEKKAKEPR